MIEQIALDVTLKIFIRLLLIVEKFFLSPSQNIIDLWSLVCSIVDVPMIVRSDSTNRSSPKIQESLVKRAKKHLEKR